MNDFKPFLPKAETEYSAMVAQFAAKSKDLTTRFFHVANQTEAVEVIQKMKEEEKWSSLASHHTPLTDSTVEKLGLPCLWTDPGYATADLEKVPVSITTCDALIAQTGSIFLTSKSCGGRAISILPPHHIVLATKEQLLSDLPAAYKYMQEKYADGYPSMMTLVTGPSRTGDIERILVLGAHGPRKLTVILIEG